MYNAIVVGARCAGASTAMLLGRKGYKVLLVDRAIFPKEIPHGHFIHRHGPQRLARWGLLERITATNCPAVTTMITDFGDLALTGHDLAVGGVAMGYGPRRSQLDKVLIDAAVEAGAEVRDGFTVEEFTSDGDCITGIRGRDQRSGQLVHETATLTIGTNARRVERFYGATDLPNFVRKAHGPGWALVGDAGCHKDPYMALGICDALRDAELLVDAIHLGLNDGGDLAVTLAGYEQERNAATLEQYRQNLHLAQFKPMPPAALALRRKLHGRREEIRAFYLANQGMVPREHFFNPENLQRLMGM